MASIPQNRVVGRYALHGEIAAGGMATVHYGRLLGSAGFSRAVAVKRLHPQFAKDPDFVGMFLDEARLASRIRHPNVVSILDVVADGGELFLVMEYVQGEALSKLVRAAGDGGLPVPVALAIGVGVLEGLHAAHEARGEDNEALAIVHRDVSPQNVLVGIDGVARIIDFGVAKAIGNARLTREGELKGKIAYMAPEQIRSEPVDRRADVYAASVVLWEALTGRRFLNASSEAALMHLALNGGVQPPSAHRPGIPPELDRLVLRGIARNPADRFATAREMAQALERVATPAATRDVGVWVEAMAGRAVRERADKIGAMEAESQVTGLPDSAPAIAAGHAAARAATPAAIPPGPAPLAAGSPDLSSISVSAARAGGSARSGRAWSRVAIAVGFAVAAVGGFYMARVLPRSGAPSADAPREAASSMPVGAGDLDAKPPRPADTAAATVLSSAEPSASPAVSAPSSARPIGYGSVPLRPGGSATRPVRPGALPAGCSPPYTITADGLREYKPHCLR